MKKKIIKIMKLSGFLFLLTVLQVLAVDSYSQRTKLTLDLKNVTVEDALKTIEDQSEFFFLYSPKMVDVSRKVDIELANKEVDFILNQMFTGTGVDWVVKDRQIVITTDEMIQPFKKETPQQIVVTGKVTDEDGNPLPGVNIVVKGTITGTITGAAGNFSVEVEDPDATLVFSFIGYRAQEVAIAGRAVINITLAVEAFGLEEIVAIGYGTQKRSNLTGSVSDVSGEKLTERTTMQTSDALQGITSGIWVNRSSGQPGSQSNIRVRGIGSLTLGVGEWKNDPLVLIDGVAANLSDVEPSSIQSISVLKDAAAAAIYGSRSANGVILIQTKRGQKDKILVNYNFYISGQKATMYPEYMGGYEYMTGINEALVNEGKSSIYTDEYIQEWQENHPSDQYPNTDWQSELYQDFPLQQSHNLSINMGTENIQSFVNFTYKNQDGLVPNYNYKKYGMRINNDIQVSNNLGFKFNINTYSSEISEINQGIWSVLSEMHSSHPIWNSTVTIDGEEKWGPAHLGRNPVAAVHEGGRDTNKKKHALLQLQGNYKIMEGLALNVEFSPYYTTINSKNFDTKIKTYYSTGELAYITPSKNLLSNEVSENLQIYFKSLLYYEKSINDHNINLLLGYDQTSFKNSWVYAYRDEFILPNLQVIDAGSIENQRTGGSGYEWSLRSTFGRFNYNFNGKYLFEANFRHDGSSRFYEGNKYSLFPSFSAGWRLSEESFMENLEFVSNLKFRTSWGKLGNQQIGTYPFTTFVDLGTEYNQAFGDQAHDGAQVEDLADRNISWETTSQTNFGLDLGLFKNKLSVLFDYYLRRTNDILLRLPIPETVGFNAPFRNAGIVDNNGWDLSLIYTNKVNEFSYSVSFNLSDVHNEVIDLSGTGPYNYNYTTIREGHPINAIYGYEADGLFNTEEEIGTHATQFGTVIPGDIRYKDQNADGVINAEDNVVIGNQIPRLIYSLDLTANYKGFDGRIFIQGIGDVDGYLEGSSVWAFYLDGNVQKWQWEQHWTPEKPDDGYPRLFHSWPNNLKSSSYWMRSAAYVRLKNVQLGYTLPYKWTNQLKISKLRIYLTGEDILTLHDFYPGWDPEANLGSGKVFPFMATYSIGVNVEF